MTLTIIDKQLIGLLLITAIGSFYSYHNYDTIDRSNLNKVYGTLKEEPYEGSHGGDITFEYIRLKLNESESKFYIKSCAYDNLSLQKLQRLDPGDSLDLGVLEPIDEKQLNVYELYSNEQGHLLKLDSYNYCSREAWKYSFYASCIVGLILAYKIGKKLYNLLRGGKPT